MTTVNWADIIKDASKGNGFDPIPEGTYTVVVFKAEASTSKNGNQMITVTYKIAEGPHAKRQIINRHVVTDKAYGMFIGALKSYGITAEWLTTNNPGMEEVAIEMLGKYVTINVVKSVWEGRERNEVKGLPRAAEAPVDGIPVFGASDPSNMALPPVPSGLSDVPAIPGTTQSPASNPNAFYPATAAPGSSWNTSAVTAVVAGTTAAIVADAIGDAF